MNGLESVQAVDDTANGIGVGESPRSVLKAEDRQRLSQVRTFRSLIAVFGDWAIIALAIWAAGRINHIAAYAIAVFIVGNRMHGLAFLGHEAVHGLLVRPRWLNNVMGEVLCMWPLVFDLTRYRAFHMKHHRHLNTLEDPEMAFRKGGGWDVPRTPANVALRFFFDLSGGCIAFNLRLVRYFFPTKPTKVLGMAATWGVAIAALALTGNLWVLLLWFVALGTALGTFVRFRTWLEHIAASDTHSLSFSWWQGWLFAPHYSWLHWQHHEWPSIPCWNLPEARALAPATPTLTFWELFSFYRDCPRIESGAPLRDSSGKSLIPAS